MKKEEIISGIQTLFSACPRNTITEQDAIHLELAGLKFYDTPLIGFAAARDPLFDTLQQPEVIGP